MVSSELRSLLLLLGWVVDWPGSLLRSAKGAYLSSSMVWCQTFNDSNLELAPLIAHHTSLSMIYLPNWFATGIPNECRL